MKPTHSLTELSPLKKISSCPVLYTSNWPFFLHRVKGQGVIFLDWFWMIYWVFNQLRPVQTNSCPHKKLVLVSKWIWICSLSLGYHNQIFVPWNHPWSNCSSEHQELDFSIQPNSICIIICFLESHIRISWFYSMKINFRASDICKREEGQQTSCNGMELVGILPGISGGK